MTRARDHLIMLYQYETPAVNQIRQILASPDVLDNDSTASIKAA